MKDYKLTENQTNVLFNITLDEGAWFDAAALQAAEANAVKDARQGKVILNQLIKKGVIAVDTTVEEGSSWLTLTSLGGEIIGDLITQAGLDTEEVLAPEPDAEEDEDLLGDVSVDEDEDLLGDIQADVIEGTPANEVADALAELYEQQSAGDVDTVSHDQVVSHTENYTVNEWADADETEWTETIFADGSRTLKRRRLVSDAWRTDYWGAEFSGDKERATTAKLAKMARAYGRFTHTPHVADAA